MSNDQKAVSIEEFLLTNALRQAALLELLEEKGLVSRDEVLERSRLIQDRREPRQAGCRASFENALIEVASLADGSSRLARGVNLSSGGLLLDTPETLEEGSTVVMRFWTPEALQPFELCGVVVRMVPEREMAIRFISVSPEASQAVNRCLVARGSHREPPRESPTAWALQA